MEYMTILERLNKKYKQTLENAQKEFPDMDMNELLRIQVDYYKIGIKKHKPEFVNKLYEQGYNFKTIEYFSALEAFEALARTLLEPILSENINIINKYLNQPINVDQYCQSFRNYILALDVSYTYVSNVSFKEANPLVIMIMFLSCYHIMIDFDENTLKLVFKRFNKSKDCFDDFIVCDTLYEFMDYVKETMLDEIVNEIKNEPLSQNYVQLPIDIRKEELSELSSNEVLDILYEHKTSCVLCEKLKYLYLILNYKKMDLERVDVIMEWFVENPLDVSFINMK